MSVESFELISELQEHLKAPRAAGAVIGLVPTMGALHEGHGSLIGRAREECDFVVVSVFVNPTQFGAQEDLGRYPRNLADDLVFCEVRKVDVVFAPTEAEMYPAELHTWVMPGIESENLCGGSRPGHFKGVATIVLKLLNAVLPQRAYFGEKDLQQLAVIRRMVSDLNVPARIVACPTYREADGLAVSSRNAYLTAEERHVAGVLYRALRVAKQRIADGNPDPNVALEAARMVIELEPLGRVDYLEVVDPDDMQPVGKITGPVRVAGAIWIGKTRLIDNVLCPKAKKKTRRRKKGEA